MRINLKQVLVAFKARRIKWSDIKNNGDAVFQAGWRLGVLLLLIGMVVFVIKGLRNDGYTITALQAPVAFVDAGFSGPVLAKKLIDELQEVNQFVSSQKADVLSGIQSDVDRPDLDVQVMGIGLTLNSVTYHLRELLGRQNRTIGGELTDIDHTLSLTLRMTGFPPQTFSYPYEEGALFAALKSVLNDAARQIIQNLDPYRMAVYHYKKGHSQKSLEVINETLLKRPTEAAWAYMAWGNLLNKENKPKEAIDKFRRATEIDPNLELAWSNWAWTEFELKNFEEALSLFQKLTKINPKAGGHWNSTAFCLRALGRNEEAEAAYAKAIKVDPQTIWWYGNWADFKFSQGDTAGIDMIIKKLVNTVDLKGVDYYLAQASFNRYRQRPDEAITNLEDALALDPNHLTALQLMLSLKFNLRQDLSNVKELCTRLISLAEKQTERKPHLFRQTYYNYMAMAEHQLEQYDSAMVHVQMAIALDTTVAYPYTTLAEIHGLSGNDEGFYQALETALSKGFSNVETLKDTDPYRLYAAEPRYRALLQKYAPKEQDGAVLADNPN